MEKLLIIDSNSIINRAFYGVRYLSAPDGTPTNAVYGFLMTLFKTIEQEKPDYIFAAFDLKAPTFRHKMYKEYKAQRKPMPQDLVTQMPIAKEILSAMGIEMLQIEGYEADDIIGTVSRECGRRNIKCLIATGDKDDLQLADDFTSILLTTTRNGATDTEEYTPKEVFDRFGVTPTEYIDVKALMGDPSDNIPGVAGIGEKTAIELIKEYKSIEKIYDDFDSLGFKGAKEKKLREGKDSAFLSKTLATIDTKVPITIDFESAKGGIDTGKDLYNILLKLGLNSIIKRLDFSDADKVSESVNPIENTTKTILYSDDEILDVCKKIKQKGECGIIFDTNTENVTMVGVSIDNDGYALCNDNVIALIADILCDKNVKKICHGAKQMMTKVADKTEFYGLDYDVEIAAYLINSSKSHYLLEEMAVEYFSYNPFVAEEKQISLFDDNEDTDLENLITKALLLKPLKEKTLQKLKDSEQEKLYYDIELPLVTVLADMQKEGIGVDRNSLHEFGEMLSEKIKETESEIYKIAGLEFNISSPKQLGEVLFEKMQLKSKKKNKTGYSTSAEVLESLRGENPIIDLVLDYRRYTKLKSTYCDGLEAVISDKTKKIHSVFNQTVTVTGRISSTEPNLQNIPTRTELGRELRKMFVASDGNVFVDADYSQIELRVLASLANDKAMTEAFLSGADIHRKTASEVLHIPESEVTKEQRSGAKAVNFGIVYGMGEFSLAKDLGISVKEARNYIEGYLSLYSGVKDYMDNTKNQAKIDGFVKTMFNRIRYLPELKSSNFNIRNFGERAAMNTPIQGTAADIIKLAMIKVHRRLKDEGLKAKLILQVHDELIIESPIEEKEKVSALLKEEMENAVRLSVPLIAEVQTGRSWYDCK